MLTENPIVQKALIKAHSERLIRVRNGVSVMNDSRFASVVDDGGAELGAVTHGYKLIQTSEIVSVLDLYADHHGINLEPKQAFYHAGKAKIIFAMPGKFIPDKGRDGGYTPEITLQHGLGGKGGISFSQGIRVLVCSNGMTAMRLVRIEYARHTRGVDLESVVVRALKRIDENVDETFRFIQASKATSVNWEVETAKVAASIGKRRENEAKVVLGHNARDYGFNAWGIIQGITELATHSLSTRQDGSHVWSADAWATAEINRVASDNGIALVVAR